MEQPYYGGIEILSGNKVIYQHPSGIKDSADNDYKKKREIESPKMVEKFKTDFKERVKQSIVRESLRLNDNTYMTIELIPNGFYLKYIIPQNKFRFWITTPDADILGIKIGANRHLDPGFEARFDICVGVQSVNVTTLDNINFSELPIIPPPAIDIVGANIPGKALLKVKAFRKVAESAKKEIHKMFANGNLISLKDTFANLLNRYLRDSKLPEEMANDETRNIRYGVKNGSLTITHPHSALDTVRRNAPTRVGKKLNKGRRKERRKGYSIGSTSVSNGMSGPKFPW